ncbi:hypothetical protein HYV74_04000 [Candidatus Uhrbacteria bacterium]|nr:hypothetical protein [Candidatus Uhrbacteria bacterium]
MELICIRKDHEAEDLAQCGIPMPTLVEMIRLARQPLDRMVVANPQMMSAVLWDGVDYFVGYAAPPAHRVVHAISHAVVQRDARASHAPGDERPIHAVITMALAPNSGDSALPCADCCKWLRRYTDATTPVLGIMLRSDPLATVWQVEKTTSGALFCASMTRLPPAAGCRGDSFGLQVYTGDALTNELVRDVELRVLLDAAMNVRRFGHAPYSKFQVGAALTREPTSAPIVGTNVENSVYAGIHAEQAAIVRMVNEYPCTEPPSVWPIQAIAVALVAEGEHQHALPCGICRQWIREFGNPETEILGAKLRANGDLWALERTTLGALLPFDFGPQNL